MREMDSSTGQEQENPIVKSNRSSSRAKNNNKKNNRNNKNNKKHDNSGSKCLIDSTSNVSKKAHHGHKDANHKNRPKEDSSLAVSDTVKSVNTDEDVSGSAVSVAESTQKLKAEIEMQLEQQKKLLADQDAANTKSSSTIHELSSAFQALKNKTKASQQEETTDVTTGTNDNSISTPGASYDSKEKAPIEEGAAGGQPSKSRAQNEEKGEEVPATGKAATQQESPIEPRTGLPLFEPMGAQLDAESKCAALVASLRRQLGDQLNETTTSCSHKEDELIANSAQVQRLLEPICRQLVQASDSRSLLEAELHREKSRSSKLESLCRELQRTNSSISSKSKDLIREEHGHFKDFAERIDETLKDAVRLFEESEQRNIVLRKENHNLQLQLRSLLDHCNEWQKIAQVQEKEKLLSGQLAKAEMARVHLLHNEHLEKLLCEKRDLLKLVGNMRDQQAHIQAGEAKLRQDLSAYATKYDQCRLVISDGMAKFEAESKKMLAQMEKSKRDYKSLLSKYQTTVKKLSGVMEEKCHLQKMNELHKRKVGTLERLCRALSENNNNNKQNTNADNNNTNGNKAGPVKPADQPSNQGEEATPEMGSAGDNELVALVDKSLASCSWNKDSQPSYHREWI